MSCPERRESRDSRRESRDSRRESRDSRRESRDSRRESRDSRRESQDSRRGSGDSRRGSGDSHRGSGDSHRGSGDSRRGSFDIPRRRAESRRESFEVPRGRAESHRASFDVPRGRAESRSSGSEIILSAGSSDSSPSRPRDENELPLAFGRIPDKTEETDLDVLQRMTKCFTHEPLCYLTKLLDGEEKVKVWTRNFQSVRGVCTGYVVAFDKHWNLVLRDVKETFIKPKRNKTPFLNMLQSADGFQELPQKVCKSKKKQIQEELTEVKPELSEKRAKKKRRKRIKTVQLDQKMKQIFIRGDSIVMLGIERKSAK